jgi:hypothetical protein
VSVLVIGHRGAPTLEAVTALCAGRVGMDIEIKHRGDEEQVLDVVSRRFSPQRILITSFDDEVITSVKRADARIKCRLLFGGAPAVAGIITDFPGVTVGLRDRRPPVRSEPTL